MKFKVDYIDKCDDLCHVCVDAVDEENARYEVLDEYWDVKQIIQVCKYS